MPSPPSPPFKGLLRLLESHPAYQSLSYAEIGYVLLKGRMPIETIKVILSEMANTQAKRDVGSSQETIERIVGNVKPKDPNSVDGCRFRERLLNDVQELVKKGVQQHWRWQTTIMSPSNANRLSLLPSQTDTNEISTNEPKKSLYRHLPFPQLRDRIQRLKTQVAILSGHISMSKDDNKTLELIKSHKQISRQIYLMKQEARIRQYYKGSHKNITKDMLMADSGVIKVESQNGSRRRSSVEARTNDVYQQQSAVPPILASLGEQEPILRKPSQIDAVLSGAVEDSPTQKLKRSRFFSDRSESISPKAKQSESPKRGSLSLSQLDLLTKWVHSEYKLRQNEERAPSPDERPIELSKSDEMARIDALFGKYALTDRLRLSMKEFIQMSRELSLGRLVSQHHINKLFKAITKGRNYLILEELLPLFQAIFVEECRLKQVDANNNGFNLYIVKDIVSKVKNIKNNSSKNEDSVAKTQKEHAIGKDSSYDNNEKKKIKVDKSHQVNIIVTNNEMINAKTQNKSPNEIKYQFKPITHTGKLAEQIVEILQQKRIQLQARRKQAFSQQRMRNLGLIPNRQGGLMKPKVANLKEQFNYHLLREGEDLTKVKKLNPSKELDNRQHWASLPNPYGQNNMNSSKLNLFKQSNNWGQKANKSHQASSVAQPILYRDKRLHSLNVNTSQDDRVRQYQIRGSTDRNMDGIKQHSLQQMDRIQSRPKLLPPVGSVSPPNQSRRPLYTEPDAYNYGIDRNYGHQINQSNNINQYNNINQSNHINQSKNISQSNHINQSNLINQSNNYQPSQKSTLYNHSNFDRKQQPRIKANSYALIFKKARAFSKQHSGSRHNTDNNNNINNNSLTQHQPQSNNTILSNQQQQQMNGLQRLLDQDSGDEYLQRHLGIPKNTTPKKKRKFYL